jgi:stage V sporulation protein B
MNIWKELSPKKRAFVTGTLLLTGTGFACRLLGFFYRIYLSRTIGAEGLGLFNMMHPIYGICFALCAGSIQTALSQCIAANASRGRSFFRAGTLISMGMAFVLGGLICLNSDLLARYVLLEPRCAGYLPLMGISVPFAALHACINGYYYGMQQSKVPAFSQVAEQVLRMVFVYALATWWTSEGHPITVELAVLGHLAGEAAAAGFTVLCLWLIPPEMSPARCLTVPNETFKRVVENPTSGNHVRTRSGSIFPYAAELMELALPLMGNRLILNLLASAEAILIPSRLQMSGLSNAEALAVYGVLTGMAMPFILFPSTISNSMAVLLLPGVAQAQAEGKHSSITASITLSLRYSLYMGILCIGIFTLFGNALGSGVFHDAQAGQFIRILAWLCPFLYLATTLGSILNGLGHTRTTFLQNTVALTFRLVFVLFGIPRYGIHAYLVGMLASELLLATLHLITLYRQIPFTWDAVDMIVKPAVLMVISIGIYHFLASFYQNMLSTVDLSELPVFPQNIPLFLTTALQIAVVGILYTGFLLLFHLSKKK